MPTALPSSWQSSTIGHKEGLPTCRIRAPSNLCKTGDWCSRTQETNSNRPWMRLMPRVIKASESMPSITCTSSISSTAHPSKGRPNSWSISLLSITLSSMALTPPTRTLQKVRRSQPWANSHRLTSPRATCTLRTSRASIIRLSPWAKVKY